MNTDSFDRLNNNHGLYLTTNPGAVVKSLNFDVYLASISATGFSTTLPNPAAYLSNYIGTYPVSSEGSVASIIVYDPNSDSFGDKMHFNATSVTIGAVPEPSTYALGIIATGVMAAVVRRRKALKG